MQQHVTVYRVTWHTKPSGEFKCPVRTELFFEGKTTKQIERMTRLNLFERLGQPEDIARVVSFLLSPGGRLECQTIRANGGMV